MKESTHYKLLPTKKPNMPTIQSSIGDKKLLLYSKYDPSRDSKAFAEKVYDEEVSNYLIYGLGLAYHIEALEELIKNNNKNYHIYVVECNTEIYNIAQENSALDRILSNGNITLILIGKKDKSYERLVSVLSLENIKIAIHTPSLNIIPNEFIELKHLLEEFQVKQNTINNNKTILDNNFTENIKNFDANVDSLFAKFKDKPLYLVSAGPSLDKNIHDLSKVKEKGIILSVGRAVRPLVAAGITPDYIIITDPSDYLYDMQLKGLEIDVPIIVLSTCDSNVMRNYKGFKYIALQNGYSPAEDYANLNNNILVKTGGSVATTGLDVAIRMGCNPIIFVGQDLAYTDEKSHAKETFSKDVVYNDTLRDVEDIYGNTIKTSVNLYIYLRWIQNRIEEEENINFIDATEGGAKIKGTKVMKLKDIIVNTKIIQKTIKLL